MYNISAKTVERILTIKLDKPSLIHWIIILFAKSLSLQNAPHLMWKTAIIYYEAAAHTSKNFHDIVRLRNDTS